MSLKLVNASSKNEKILVKQDSKTASEADCIPLALNTE